MFRYPQGRGSGGPPPDVPGRLPYEMPQHVPIGALATSLANASPEHQRTVIKLLLLFSKSYVDLKCCDVMCVDAG